MTGDADTTMRFSELLLDEGLYVQGIRPPTVPAGSCRLRFTLMATHGDDDLAWAAERIAAAGRRMGVI
jgi:7-keto-8-aminopelargonate synthetase-like enzyme